jgi:hypothetical protein
MNKMIRLSLKSLTLIALVFGISSQAVKADVDLTDGIRAFICDGNTLALQETEEGWAFASGFPLSKTSEGWRWENDGSAYLSERKSGEWVLEVLSPQGYQKSECVDITDGVAHVIEVVKPKLNNNILAVIAELAEVKTELARAKANSLRPPQRHPARAEPMAQEQSASSKIDDFLDGALRQVTETPRAPNGTLLSAGEKDALGVSVQDCWHVGSLSSLALETTVVVAVSLMLDGKPVVSSIRQVGSEGGTSASAKQAFETARRAIIRCGARGFKLPISKYDQWKDLEMTFNPNDSKGVRIK